MRPPGTKSHTPSFPLDAPLTNRGVSRVLRSAHARFRPGDTIVTAAGTGTEAYSVLPRAHADTARVLANPHGLPASLFVGALGMTGLTAWSSLYEIGRPRRGETLFVSAASGAVGQVVGQLAKREGLRVFGSVGDDRKLDYILTELGFDGGFNYKTETPAAALQRMCPDGLDIYYDNVGGEQLDAALYHMKPFGRIGEGFPPVGGVRASGDCRENSADKDFNISVACGMVSQYNLPPDQQYHLRNAFQVVSMRVTMQGFIVTDPGMGPKYHEEHQEKLQKWISEVRPPSSPRNAHLG